MQISGRTLNRLVFTIFILAGLTLTPVSADQAGRADLAGQIDIVGPAGSERFGRSVTALPNGNIVVTDPYYDAGTTVDVGAVYLYDGATGALISTLTGSTAGDQVGIDGVTVLSNGNYVVISRYWDNGGATDAGAATWGGGTAGVSGIVSLENSLVGKKTDDRIGYGYGGVTALSNGNYVVRSPDWNNGETTDAGAVTWGDGTIGVSGVVSSTNSLVGSTAGDRVGYGVTALSNGNYVVISRYWDNAEAEYAVATNAGAVTWGNGTTGTRGVLSSSNSLVGSTAGDWVGRGVLPLSNGNYVVHTSLWDNGGVADAGAVTWGNGTTGTSGVVSSTNSLVGSTTNNQVGYGVTALSNGDYVVRSPSWDNGGVENAGAATWGNGATGTSGVVSSTNSLVGSTTGDLVGLGVVALSNGNYVVVSHHWDNGGAADAGAATWGDGTVGVSGVVSSTNSLVGSTTGDQVGINVTALSNGDYVVRSPDWDNGGVADAGAATWGDGTIGISGVVSSTNSLVGSTPGDQVGMNVTALSNGNYVVGSRYWDNGGATDTGAATWGGGTVGVSGEISSTNSLVGSTSGDQVGSSVTALSNGNYVVGSRYWDNGGATDTGAVMWGNGTTGTSGVVSSSNSLVGSTTDDQVGHYVLPLSNGNYVVHTPLWDNGGATDAGAATWGDGTTDISGVVSSTNSLVGSTTNDWLGDEGPIALSVGHYVVISPFWDNGGVTDAGAVTWGDGTRGVRGPITGVYSVRGTTAGAGFSMVFAYDDTNVQLVVGRPAENTVSLLRPPCIRVWVPLVSRNSAP